MKRRGSSLFRTVTAAVAALGLWACGDHTTSGTQPNTTGTGSFEGVDEAEKNLTPLATACSYADGGIVTIAMAAGEYSLIAKNATTGAIQVNGTACGAATASNVTRINVTGSADGGSETVILDYLNGSFALGSASSPGVSIDLRNGASDSVKIRGTGGVDTVLLATAALDAGTSGQFALALGLNGTAPTGIKNVLFTNVESLVVSTGPGDDVFKTNGQADAGVGGTPFGKTRRHGRLQLAHGELDRLGGRRRGER